jgi:hypothetical protein
VNPYPTVLELAKRIAALEACEEARRSPMGEPSQEMQDQIKRWLEDHRPCNPVLSNHTGPFLGAAHQAELERAHKPTATEIKQMVCQHINTYRKQTHTTSIPPQLISDITYCSDCGAIVQSHRAKPVDAGPAVPGVTIPSDSMGEFMSQMYTPPANDAAVAALVDAWRVWLANNVDMSLESKARCAIAAIRRGEVPGIMFVPPECDGPIDAARTERDQLKARVAELEAKQISGDMERAIAKDAEAERDRLAAELAAADECAKQANDEHSATRARLVDERDEARAELAALKGRKVKLPGAVGVFIEDGKPAHGMENGGRYLIKTDVIRMLAAQGVEVAQ